jgi:signal transduction histidine kinase
VESAHQAERARIARELHDVVAHQLSAIAVQAGAARVAAGGPPATGVGPATEVLATVERLSREALTELGHLLGALRRDPDGAPASRPAPTLADLGELIGQARAAGVPAVLSVSGVPRLLPAGAELSCYRIVSEALSNVARHSPGAGTRVVLSYQPAGLRIEIGSAPPPRPARPAAAPAAGRARAHRTSGLGIRGMRERAELYGGHLTAGPDSGGGFTVTAVIPYQDGATGTGPGTALGQAGGPGVRHGAGAAGEAGLPGKPGGAGVPGKPGVPGGAAAAAGGPG